MKLFSNARNGVIRFALITLMVLHASIVVLDGLIFKVFGSAEPIVTNERHRLILLNAMLALRPGNPTPHTTLILHLIETATKNESTEVRAALLQRAETETEVLAQSAPNYPLTPLLFGKIYALRGSQTDLLKARDYLELAIKHMPHSTAMRAELIKVYRRLQQDRDAYRVVIESKPWLPNETSLKSFSLFAKEAEELALAQNKPEEARYWGWIQSQITMLTPKG